MPVITALAPVDCEELIEGKVSRDAMLVSPERVKGVAGIHQCKARRAKRRDIQTFTRDFHRASLGRRRWRGILLKNLFSTDMASRQIGKGLQCDEIEAEHLIVGGMQYCAFSVVSLPSISPAAFRPP